MALLVGDGGALVLVDGGALLLVHCGALLLLVGLALPRRHRLAPLSHADRKQVYNFSQL